MSWRCSLGEFDLPLHQTGGYCLRGEAGAAITFLSFEYNEGSDVLASLVQLYAFGDCPLLGNDGLTRA